MSQPQTPSREGRQRHRIPQAPVRPTAWPRGPVIAPRQLWPQGEAPVPRPVSQTLHGLPLVDLTEDSDDDEP